MIDIDHPLAGRDRRVPGASPHFNLADADGSIRFGIQARKKRFTLSNALAALVRRISPQIAGWIVAFSGGELSILSSRLMRLRRVAGAMLSGSLTPPAPVRVQIETTDTCNLRCIHCRREKLDGMDTVTMPLDVFARLIGEIQPLYANLAGFGEPMIDRTIMDKLALLHGQSVRTAFPTNGTYIRRGKREELAAELPDVLQLSLDGATRESFESIRKQGDFDQIVENYRAICALRAEGKTRPGTIIRVLCALQRENLRDYRDMYRLIATLRGIDSFGLVPVSYGSANASQVPDREDILALHREIDTVIANTSTQEEKNFYRQWRAVSGEWLKTGDKAGSDADHRPCAVPWFSTYIDAKGRVYPCCHLVGGTQVMGTLNPDGGGFAEIWAGERYRALRSGLISGRSAVDGCRNCPRNDKAVMNALKKVRPLLPPA